MIVSFLVVDIVADEPFAVATPEASVFIDRPVAKDPDGRAIMPTTSLAGSLRHHLNRLGLDEVWMGSTNPLITDSGADEKGSLTPSRAYACWVQACVSPARRSTPAAPSCVSRPPWTAAGPRRRPRRSGPLRSCPRAPPCVCMREQTRSSRSDCWTRSPRGSRSSVAAGRSGKARHTSNRSGRAARHKDSRRAATMVARRRARPRRGRRRDAPSGAQRRRGARRTATGSHL